MTVSAARLIGLRRYKQTSAAPAPAPAQSRLRHKARRRRPCRRSSRSVSAI